MSHIFHDPSMILPGDIKFDDPTVVYLIISNIFNFEKFRFVFRT